MNATPPILFAVAWGLASAIPSGHADAQASVSVEEFVLGPLSGSDDGGLVISRRVFDSLMRGEHVDDEVPYRSTVPDATGWRLDSCVPKQVVGPRRIGFMNETGDPVAFTVEGDSRVTEFSLIGGEVMTLEAADGLSYKATVTTGSHDETIDLERGVLYRLKGDGGNWVFARF